MKDDAERARVFRAAKELAYSFASDTYGDHIDVWWSSVSADRKARYIASFEAAVRPLIAFAQQPEGMVLVPAEVRPQTKTSTTR